MSCDFWCLGLFLQRVCRFRLCSVLQKYTTALRFFEIFLFRCQVGKADFSCLPSFDFLMCIDTFVFQYPLAEAVKCAAYLPFGSFWFIHGIHLLSQPRKRVEFPLSQTLNNAKLKTAKEKRIFLEKSFCRHKKSRLHRAAGIGHEKIAIWIWCNRLSVKVRKPGNRIYPL